MTHKPFQFSVLLTLFVIICVSSLRANAEERCLADAWKAFNARHHAEASKHADDCIAQFAAAARRQQSTVQSDPPCGKVSDQEKASIHQRGLLNDVATAAWIKEKSAEALGKTRTATEAKALACELNHGRTWDPKGFFWSPCEGSCPQ